MYCTREKLFTECNGNEWLQLIRPGRIEFFPPAPPWPPFAQVKRNLALLFGRCRFASRVVVEMTDPRPKRNSFPGRF